MCNFRKTMIKFCKFMTFPMDCNMDIRICYAAKYYKHHQLMDIVLNIVLMDIVLKFMHLIFELLFIPRTEVHTTIVFSR